VNDAALSARLSVGIAMPAIALAQSRSIKPAPHNHAAQSQITESKII